MNRLAQQPSPYLRQHAHNPVDWFPWGDEAFAKARAERKPIFLSIGYSTCHWCHVMERESFENHDIAGVLNAHFVAIKLDREERPDLDRLYMTAVQATTGRGGWPMSVWLTPDLKPFYCGTYFPPEHFTAILRRIHELWQTNPTGIADQANQITEALTEHLSISSADGPLDDAPLHKCLAHYRSIYDPEHGGFGHAPKFPHPVSLNFLFRVGGHDMALHTLRKMGEGGLFDQLGGGFHRYSVDERWLVSHFEKMLYDQAQLVTSYCEAFQITGDSFYAGIAQRTCDYVLRDMASPDGAFYSAEDADSEGVEGKFYVWTRAEIASVLGDKTGAFCRAYDVTVDGNWEHGLNVLHGSGFAEESARLFEIRAQRIHPHRDEKILTGWNGLMISALCHDGRLPAATRAAQFLWERRWRDGRLARTDAVPGMLDDYTNFATALLDLHETSFEKRWLKAAVEVTDAMLRLFHDAEAGGFFQTDGTDASLLIRSKDEYDGAEPSGNSVAAMLLLRLAEHTGNEWYRDAGMQTLAAFGRYLQEAPYAAPQMLCALDFALTGPTQIAVTGKSGAKDTEALLKVARECYVPRRVLLFKPQNIPANAQVCVNRVCQLPVTSPTELKKLLESGADAV